MAGDTHQTAVAERSSEPVRWCGCAGRDIDILLAIELMHTNAAMPVEVPGGPHGATGGEQRSAAARVPTRDQGCPRVIGASARNLVLLADALHGIVRTHRAAGFGIRTPGERPRLQVTTGWRYQGHSRARADAVGDRLVPHEG